MLLHRGAVVAGLATLALFALVGVSLSADDEATARRNHLEPLAKYLGLTADQKEKMEKICTDYESKEDPLVQQITNMHHQEREALAKVLTDEQRAKLPEIIKGAWQQTLARMDRRLGLTAEQQERVQKIHDEYAPKYRKLAETKTTKPADFRTLRRQEFAAIGNELNDEQRARLPFIVKDESQQWHNPEVRQEHLRYFADKLGMTDEQKERAKKIQDEYASRGKEQVSELMKLRKAEMDAMSGVLTEAQRSKVEELRKASRSEKD